MNVRQLSIPQTLAEAWSRIRCAGPGFLVRSAAPAALRLGGALLQLVATILIARTLGAGPAGIFFFWSTIIRSLGQVSTLGLDRLSLQQVPRLNADPAALSRFLAPIRVSSILVAIGLAGLVSSYAFIVQNDVTRPAWWYLLPPVCMAGVALCMINGEVMNGIGRPVLGVCYRHTLSTAIFILALLSVGSNLTPDFALLCFTMAFAVAGFGALLGPGLHTIRPRFRKPTKDEIREHFRLGFPICLSSIFVSLNFMVPLAILERSHPSEQIAYLTTAYRIFMLFEVLATAAYALAMPELSRAAEAEDHHRLWRIYRGAVFKGLLLFGSPLLIAFGLAGPIMSIFGAGFNEAGGVLRVFIVFAILSLVCGPATHLILMVGATGRMAAYAFFRLATTAFLALLAIPTFGPAGMASVLGIGIIMEKVLCLRRSAIISQRFRNP